jgi:hypothetical protein
VRSARSCTTFKGFVAAHTALTAFDSWSEFGGCSAHATTTILGAAPGTIINRPVVPRDEHFRHFPFVDEFYQPRVSRVKLRALRLDVSKMPPNQTTGG